MKLETSAEVTINRRKPRKPEIVTTCFTGQAGLRLGAQKGGEKGNLQPRLSWKQKRCKLQSSLKLSDKSEARHGCKDNGNHMHTRD